MNATSRRVLACLTAVLAAAGGSASAPAQQTRPAQNLLANPGLERQEAGGAGVSAYDTVAASAEALSGEALARRASFLRLAEDKTDHAFGGDAVLVNNRLAVVLRKKGAGAEVYSIGKGAIVRRAVLAPASASAVAIDSIRLAQNSSSQAALEVVFKAADGKNVAMRFEVKMGQPFVCASGLQGAAGLRVQAPCRFAVLPDFFADDIVLDAARLGSARAELPGENLLLHLLEGGEAIVADVWAEAVDDVVATLAGQDAQRRIESADIPFGKKAKAWVAVLEAPGIWHRFDVAQADAGKVVPLGWKAPFPAQWRLDWRRDNGLADSWEMLLQRPSGDFLKQGMFGSPQTIPPDRKRWTTVLGTFPYPCWIDRGGQGLVQPLQSPAVRFEGPAVLYPIGRANNTPLDACTVIDVLRSTLGVGPCEYVLDVEGQRQVSRGRATCSNRDTLDPIYQSGQQRQKRAEIERSLNETLLFIQYIRSRIEGYVQTGHEVRDYLAEQKKARPDLAGPIAELEALAGLLDARVAARKDRIKTPRQAAAMMEEFRKDGLDDEGPHALEKCQKFTAAIVEIGGNQDELVGECRWAVKVLRQQAALTMAGEPRMADIAREVRLRTQKALRSPAGHESAAH